MAEIELSFMVDDPSAGDHLRSILDEFEARYRIHVRQTLLTYEEAWASLVKYGLYSHGPDVSQIGSTWVSNLVSMNALRPFAEQDLAVVGAPSAWNPTIWQAGLLPGSGPVWAIPWLSDSRVIYFRRDLLEQAGVDENTAFDSPEHLEQTLACLRASGVAAPWVVITDSNISTLHFVSSWVWRYGGDFVSADGNAALFSHPEALRGLRAYFDLYRYLPPGRRLIGEAEANNVFLSGNAAVTISGSWAWSSNVIQRAEKLPTAAANLGVALPLGIPFTGSESLVVWRHCRQPSAAIQLIQFLTSRPVQLSYAPRAGLLPVRRDLLSEPPFTTDPIFQVMAHALRAGRSFPAFPRWGLIEDRLVEALAQIWKEILATPNPDVETLIRRQLEPLARRLNLSLEFG